MKSQEKLKATEGEIHNIGKMQKYAPHRRGGGGQATRLSPPWVYMSVSQGASPCISARKWQRHRQIVVGFGRHGGGHL